MVYYEGKDCTGNTKLPLNQGADYVEFDKCMIVGGGSYQQSMLCTNKGGSTGGGSTDGGNTDGGNTDDGKTDGGDKDSDKQDGDQKDGDNKDGDNKDGDNKDENLDNGSKNKDGDESTTQGIVNPGLIQPSGASSIMATFAAIVAIAATQF